MERQFFFENDRSVLPSLIGMYFEQEKFALAYYLSSLYADEFEELSDFKARALEALGLTPLRAEVHETHGKLATFENLKWSIWEKYNAKLRLQPPDEFHMSRLFERDDFQICSYKPHCVAAAMHILTDDETSIILDCGAELTAEGVERIPVREIVEHLGLALIDGVFISHAHFDHYGSLNALPNVTRFMTQDTFNIIRIMSPEIAPNNSQCVDMYSTIELDGVRVTFIPNGHIQGSALFDIDWKGERRIIFTGDFCIEDQVTCRGLNLDDLTADGKAVDILITESTYGRSREILPLKCCEEIFVELCRIHFQQSIKIIIPSFAVGRAAEVALLLRPLARKFGCKILIDGLAANMTEYYQNTLGIPIVGANITVNRNCERLDDNILDYDIIIASSGMLKPGSASYRYMQSMLNLPRVCVMKVGFIREYEDMLVSVLNRQGKNLSFFDVPLSAHASRASLTQFIDRISAINTLYVHGSGIEPLCFES